MILAVVLGICFGVVTGLVPGLHVNLASLIIVGVLSYYSFIEVHFAAVLICAMAVTHTFLDAIPSIFLGMPSNDMALAVMPGHRLLIRGRGHEGVKLTVIGSLLCLILAVLLVPLFAYIFPYLYAKTRNSLSLILICVAAVMLSREKGANKVFWAVFVFLVSGILGMIVWVSSINQPLMPLLSGLFGVSTMIVSLTRNIEIPKQDITEEIKPDAKSTLGAVLAGTVSGSFTALFPGIGASQAAVIASSVYMNAGEYIYLIIVGGVNTVNFVVGLVSFYALQKARNGAVASMMQIIGRIDLGILALLVFSALTAGGISAFLALKFSRIFAANVWRVNYRLACILLIVFVSALSLIISGVLGLMVLWVSASVGIIPHLLNIGKRHCMGCLLLPVIVYFM